MRSSAGRVAVAAVLVALLGVGLAAPAVGQASDADSAMHVALEPDGDAQWTVSVRFPLDDANQTAAFDRLADEFVAGESDALSADPYRNAASLASNATGREMAVEGVSRAAERSNGTGVLRLTFTWTDFARVEQGGEQLVLGDVFSTPSGTWLPSLYEGQLLVIEFPEGYAVESVSRGFDNGTIRVTGPATFEPGRPSAILLRTGPGTTEPPPDGGAFPSGLSAGAALAILLVAGYLVYRGRTTGDEVLGGGGDAGAGATAGEPDEEELLSDEERVLRLLRTEGGRMKQVDIVEETDWSNAKVSQLLSGMAEAGRIEKLRIGRENLISLPEDAVSDEE